MWSSSCSCLAQFCLEIGGLRLSRSSEIRVSTCLQSKRYPFRVVRGSRGSDLFGLLLLGVGTDCHVYWSFAGGRTVVDAQRTLKPVVGNQKGFQVNSSWLASSKLASAVFTMGTIAVLPFYSLMVAAPKAEMTRKCIQSSVPFIVLGLVYAYLLYLSWTPDTLRLMFASKYWLPELPGIARMFSNQMTLASAWIHLLAVDLFAARQIFQDGLENEIETRHSVSLCLLFCPVGIMAHFITKALMERARSY